ncbi:MAG: FAD-dependent monooxygenase [Pseudomonadota bacterium]
MVELERIDVLGGGPAGLYAAYLLKRERSSTRVRVLEQNPRGATFGFGVVFSDQALDFLKADDPKTHALITPHMERWRNMTLAHKGQDVVIDGVGFAAIGRLRLIELLCAQAEEMGVEVQFDHHVEAVDALDADLIVGADGLNSLVRQSEPEAFNAEASYFDNHFAWFGAKRPFDTLTQTFIETSKGAMNAHHYRYQPDMSTFIVECDQPTFDAFGFADMSEMETARTCEGLFAEMLDGASLVINKSTWRRFPKMWCRNWVSGNRVILGDAAHTAHFSVGSGTRLAMEDALALAVALESSNSLDSALVDYQQKRTPIARKIVEAANTSALWYDDFASKMALGPLEFGYDYITRSGRMDDARLRKLSPNFMATYDAMRAAA